MNCLEEFWLGWIAAFLLILIGPICLLVYFWIIEDK